MPFLSFPFALVALTALPALAAIYWLRNKHRQVTVSSLMLFADHQRPREGGVKLQRSGLPWLFFLELLALALLALAATGPQLRLSREERPLVVILDDSYPMLAGGRTDSPRALAQTELQSVLAANSGEPTRLILAGPTPGMLGDVFRSASEARPLLDSWNCRGASSDMPRALAMARELGGTAARILVLTDRPPTDANALGDRLRWISKGEKRSNVAIVNASRTAFETQHRILLEVANHSEMAASVPLRVDKSARGDQSETTTLNLGAHELKRMIFEIPATTASLNVSLPEDALNVDNSVVLDPPPDRTVKVSVNIADPTLRALVIDALEATGQVKMVEFGAQLRLSDGGAGTPVVEPGDMTECWNVRFVEGARTQAFLGPFVMDRSHPLTQGLSLQGVIWSADAPATTEPGTTQPTASGGYDGESVISAGNVPLITDAADAQGKHDLTIHFKPSMSTLQQDPAWAVLIWNLVAWRASEFPGPQRALVRLGESITFALPPGAGSAKVTDPLGKTRTLRASSRHITVDADAVGQYRVETQSEQYLFECAALNGDSSDLTHRTPGEWGKWVEQGEVQSAYREVGWVLALLGLIVLAVHAMLLQPWGGRVGGEST